MRRLCIALAVLTVSLIGHVLPAQANELSLSRFRVLLNDGQRLEGRNGMLTSYELCGVSMAGDQVTVLRKDIRALDRYRGTKAGTGAVVGAGMGFLSVLWAYVQVEADPDMEADDEFFAPLFLGFTLGGGIIGFAVGSASKKWERVDVDAAVGFDPEQDNVCVALRFSL